MDNRFPLSTVPQADEEFSITHLSNLKSSSLKHHNRLYKITNKLLLTSRTCLTTASEAPNKSTPEMPRTSVSTAPGDRFFFLRPGTNIQSTMCKAGSHIHVTQGTTQAQERRKRQYKSTKQSNMKLHRGSRESTGGNFKEGELLDH